MRDAIRRALAVCPVEVAISVVGGNWKLSIVKYLRDGTLRFGELRRAVGPVSERMLTRQLRELEQDGLVHRQVFAEVPPRVEYSLTELGAALAPAVEVLERWGERYSDAVRG